MERPISISCPWCGEVSTTFFDSSQGSTQYVEDCQVCCRPIVCHFQVDVMGDVSLRTERE